MPRYDSPTPAQHRHQTTGPVQCAIVTVSDTRTLADDRSGDLVEELLLKAGHVAAARKIVPDEPQQLVNLVRELAAAPQIMAILATGGTGVAPRDQTPDAIQGLFTKVLPGFGELFRMLSYQEIGSAAMLSRACAGLVGRTTLFLMPGSTPAVRLAMEQLILPELGHLVQLADKASAV